jgi:two-component system, cell cycle response regulator
MKLWPGRKATLQNRLTLGMGVMLLPLALLGLGTLTSLEGAIRTFESNGNETLESLFPLDSLEQKMQFATMTADTCLQSRQAASCERYEKLYAEINSQLSTFLSAKHLLAEQQSLLRTSQRSWQMSYQQFQWLQAQAAQRSLAEQPNQTLVRTYQEQFNKQSTDAAASVSQLYKVVVQFQLQDDLAKAEQTKQQLRLMIISGFSLGMGVAVIAGWFLARSILRPLHVLEQGVRHFGEGQLHHRILLTNQDEFGQLAHAFNIMGGKLEESQKELVDLATLDGLTGVFNRREFNKRLQVELNQAERQGYCCALIMFDIDHFKKLNDTYGHQSGDEALKCFAALLKQQVRPGDLVARYGGEEFGVILPHTTIQEAILVAERLRQAVELEPVPISLTKTLQITSSIGVSAFPEDAGDPPSLLEAADQALYAAKRGGRNQVVSYSDLRLQPA